MTQPLPLGARACGVQGICGSFLSSLETRPYMRARAEGSPQFSALWAAPTVIKGPSIARLVEIATSLTQSASLRACDG